MTKIRYLSLFSGIEAFSCAVKDMPEFEPVAFAEIEPFPCAVLAHHYPDVPNLGDVTQIDGRKYRGIVDLIVGGSPCQGFSVAGLRKGLDDPRSSLAFTYIRLVEEIQPRYLLFENVPGILSCNHGQDFRSFLAALDDLNYSLAGTVLDSEWFGVAQRRRRMFVVGCAGADWERCTKIFFEPSCLQRDPPSRRKAGQDDTSRSKGCARNSGVSGTLCASGAGLDRPSAQGNQLDYLVQDIAFAQNQRDEVRQMKVAGALSAESGMKQTTYVAQPAERERERESRAASGDRRNDDGVGNRSRQTWPQFGGLSDSRL